MTLVHLPNWSSSAPQPLTATEVEAIIARDDVFAEETVEELLDRLGLPGPYDPRERPASLSAHVSITVGKPQRWEPPARATRASVAAAVFRPHRDAKPTWP